MNLPQPFRAAALLLSLTMGHGAATAQDAADAKPRGIYTLAPVSQPITNSIRTYPFIEGVVQRISWSTLEPMPGVYDFSLIDAAIAQLEPRDQRLTLTLFNVGPEWIPAHVLTDPLVQTFAHAQAGLSVVPWDPVGLQRWDALCQALAEHQVPSAAAGGAMVPLRLHPTLAQLNAPVLGLNGFRLIGQNASTIPGYTRAQFTQGFLASIHSIRDRFEAKFCFVSHFGMNDGINPPLLKEHITTALMQEFDGVRFPRLGLFQENLSYRVDPATNVGTGVPNPTGLGSELVAASNGGSYVLLQALQGWNCPFRNPANTANATAVDGMQWALTTFDCTYFELYLCDVDDPTLWPALEGMAAQLRNAPHQENSPAAGLTLGGRAYFSPLMAGGSASLRLAGAPTAGYAVYLGRALEPAGLPLPLGLLDLDPGQPYSLLFGGVLPASGEVTMQVSVPSVAGLTGFAVQGITLASAGLRMTGRVKVLTQ